MSEEISLWVFPLRSFGRGNRTGAVDFDGPNVYREDVDMLINYLKIAREAFQPFHPEKDKVTKKK